MAIFQNYEIKSKFLYLKKFSGPPPQDLVDFADFGFDDFDLSLGMVLGHGAHLFIISIFFVFSHCA